MPILGDVALLYDFDTPVRDTSVSSTPPPPPPPGAPVGQPDEPGNAGQTGHTGEPAPTAVTTPLVVLGAPPLAVRLCATAPTALDHGTDILALAPVVRATLSSWGFAAVAHCQRDAGEVADLVANLRGLLGSSSIFGVPLAVPPLGLGVVANVVADVAPRLDAGALVATLTSTAQNLHWFAWVRHPRRLDEPSPTMGQHVMSYAPSRGYLVRSAVRSATRSDAQSAMPQLQKWPKAELAAAPSSRLLLSMPKRSPKRVRLALDVLLHETTSARQATDPAEAEWFGTRRLACGVWIPELPDIAALTNDRQLPPCRWCDHRSDCPVCPRCHSQRPELGLPSTPGRSI